MKEQVLKALEKFSDDDELILMRLEDYQRNMTQITGEKINLEEKLNKAIDYIMTNGIHSDYGDKGIDDENKLLQILKGEENGSNK